LYPQTPEPPKNSLGEKLFPLIEKECEMPQYASKITGMLLEMETSEILAVLNSSSERKQKIEEAISVLRNHNFFS